MNKNQFLFLVIAILFLGSFYFMKEHQDPSSWANHLFLQSKIEEDYFPNLTELPLQAALQLLQETSLSHEYFEGGLLFTGRNFFSKNGVLIDLLEQKEKIYPPITNQWIIENQLDYSDPDLLLKDNDHDGFTNLEEWLGSNPKEAPGTQSTDPNDPDSHPLLWVKLQLYPQNIYYDYYHFYFMGLEEASLTPSFKIQPQEAIPYRTEGGKQIRTIRMRFLNKQNAFNELPLKVSFYTPKIEIKHDLIYDSSELILINYLTKEFYKIKRKSTLNPNPISIPIIREAHFTYTLTSPPQEITVQPGGTFALESLDKKTKEFYQLIALNNQEALLEREGCYYHLPIIFNKSYVLP